MSEHPELHSRIPGTAKLRGEPGLGFTTTHPPSGRGRLPYHPHRPPGRTQHDACGSIQVAANRLADDTKKMVQQREQRSRPDLGAQHSALVPSAHHQFVTTEEEDDQDNEDQNSNNGASTTSKRTSSSSTYCNNDNQFGPCKTKQKKASSISTIKKTRQETRSTRTV